MRIQNITSYNNSHKTNFTSLFRYSSYTDMYGVERSTQNSTSIRDDLDNEKLAVILKERFKDKAKINIMPMNTSDGTESYALANKIIEVFGIEDAKKRIFPIMASDVDEFMVDEFLKKGGVYFTETDIEKFGKKNIDKYFEKADRSLLPQDSQFKNMIALKTKPEFQELFVFEKADLQERILNLKDEGNSVILIRNCLSQSFGEVKAALILSKLSNKMKPGSILVLGEYDRNKIPHLDVHLSLFELKEIEKNIFVKTESWWNSDKLKGLF